MKQAFLCCSQAHSLSSRWEEEGLWPQACSQVILKLSTGTLVHLQEGSTGRSDRFLPKCPTVLPSLEKFCTVSGGERSLPAPLGLSLPSSDRGVTSGDNNWGPFHTHSLLMPPPAKPGLRILAQAVSAQVHVFLTLSHHLVQ